MESPATSFSEQLQAFADELVAQKFPLPRVFDPDAFARRYLELLDEVEQLRARRCEAVKKIEEYREKHQSTRSALKEIFHQCCSGDRDINHIKAVAHSALAAIPRDDTNAARGD